MKYLILVLCVLGAGCASAPKGSDILVVHAGRLIDGVANEPKENVDIVIRDGRIREVGQHLPVPSGARELDLREYTVLPGLIDMHVHLIAAPEDSADLDAYSRLSDGQVLNRAHNAANTMLREGFTTVRDLGTYHSWTTIVLRGQIERGEIPGPRMQAAPYFLTTAGGGGDLPKARAHLRAGIAHGPAEFRAKTEEEIRGGAGVVKVIASGAVLAEGSIPGKPEMMPEEIAAVVETAHKAGLKVAAHAHGAQSIKDSIRAGADTIEHASLIDAEGIRLAREHRVALSMDIFNNDYINEEGRKQHWPKEFLSKNLAITDKQRANFTKAYRAGVPMVFGTDAGVFPFDQVPRQFHMMVERGMKPMDAIKSATSVAAKYMGWESDVGTVQAGRYGDLIAVRGNPLTDIRTLESVNYVIKGGRLVKTREAL